MRLRHFAAALLPLLASACANDNAATLLPASETACPTGVAQLLIMDGMSKRLCGCTEPGDTLIVPPAALNCTVAVGTQVLFRFEGTFTDHQVVFTAAGQGTLSGHWVQPAVPVTRRPHPVSFAASATYPFQDGFNSDVAGSIIVP